MRATQLGAFAAAQPAFILAVAVSDVGGHGTWLIAVHVAVGLLGVLLLVHRTVPMPVFMIGLYASLALDFVVVERVEEPLAALAFVVTNVSTYMPVMLYRGAAPVAAGHLIGAALCLAVWWAHPDWSSDLVIAMALAVPTMCWGAAVFMRAVRAFATAADGVHDDAAAERRRLLSVRAANSAAAETARVLHDTVINTLGAVATGASSGRSVVRERCRADLRRARRILGREADVAGATWLFGAAVPALPLQVQRSGLGPEELRRYEALLPDPVARALEGCAHEALINAAKHSATEVAQLDVRSDGHELRVEIIDEGVGFDGRVVPDRGLEHSVFGRAHDHGIEVQLQTAPGRGTRVILRVPLGGVEAESAPAAPNPAPAALRSVVRGACWIWCLVILGAGLLTETVNRRGELTLAHLMLLIGSALVAVAWFTCRRDRDLPCTFAWGMAAVVPVVCLFAYAAVGFGTQRPYLFQAVGTVPLVIVLLVTSRDRRPFLVAVASMTACVTVACVARWLDGGRDAAMIAILSAPIGMGVIAWLLYRWQMHVIGADLGQAWQRAFDARLEGLADELGELSRARWRAAGLQGAFALLAGIADGDLDPRAPEVRRRCAKEERYLRQLIGLTPDRAQLSRWLALALVEASMKAVSLRVQAGSVELGDARAAAVFGRLVLACLASAPEESEMVVSVLDHAGGPRLFVVGAQPLLVDIAQLLPDVQRCDIHQQVLGGQTLLEVAWRSS